MDLLNIFLVTASIIAFIYTVQLVYLDIQRSRTVDVSDTTSRKRAQLLRVLPAFCSIMATTALVFVPIFGNRQVQTCSDENITINPDVGGIGVLLGLFLPCLVLLVVLFLGHFTVHTSGAKELCMAQCANLLYLTVNLAKGKSGLSNHELVIALSSIDAVSASISMAFSDKDVLAARKLVSFGFMTQVVAYTVQAIAFGTYAGHDKFQCESPSPPQSPFTNSSTAYWIYLAFRIAASILPCHVAYRLTSSLNKIENKHNATRSPRVKATALWRSLPATLATSYLIYWSFVLLHGLSIFNILRGTNTIGQSWHSLTSEWGQSANAIIAVFAICHVLYAIYRLFVADSTDNDRQSLKPNERSTSRAYPQTGWMACKFWPWTAQRWPFHLGLDYSDHLLVDEGLLQTILNPPLQQTPEERKELWQDLMDGFTYNEPEVILECLDRGAPLDECNDEGDYPIHLAARNNNIDILMRARFVAADNIYLPKTLLPENLAGETPLEIACNANAHEAVRWIMGELPQGYERAHAAVSRAFKLAIVGEREGLLKILQQSWPDWRALKIKTGTTSETTPLRFAIDEGKVKSAYRLVNPIVTAKRQPHARRIFDMMWKSQLEDGGYLEIILDQDQKSIDLIPYAIVDEVMRSSTISNAEILEILLNVGIDISAVLRQSIYYAVRPTTHPHQDNNVWEEILREDHVIEPKDLDSILSFEIPADSSPIPEVEVKKDSMRAALSLRGGQDWSGVVKASTSPSIEDLEKIMNSEDGTMLQRMLCLKDKDGYSLLRFTISHGMYDSVEKQKQRLEYTDLLLQHGIEVTVPDLMAARERLFHHEGTLATFMLLASYITHDVALDLLYKMCSGSWHRNGIHHSTFDLIHILLRCGVDPTLLNGSGKTPRIALRDTMAEKPTKKVPMMDERATKRLEVTNRAHSSRISKLLLRWENHVKGSGGVNPLEMPDEDWVALRTSIGDEETWTWLVEKNPEGYKVAED